MGAVVAAGAVGGCMSLGGCRMEMVVAGPLLMPVGAA